MLQFVIAGLVLGGIYAIASAGLVITYTSSGILNFAFGAMAFFIARFYYYLHTQHGWSIASVGHRQRRHRCARARSVPLRGALPLPAAVVPADQGRGHHRSPRRLPCVGHVVLRQPSHPAGSGARARTSARVPVPRGPGDSRPGHRLHLRRPHRGDRCRGASLHRGRAEGAGHGRLAGHDGPLGDQPHGDLGRGLGGQHILRGAVRRPRRANHRPRCGQLHPPDRGLVRRRRGRAAAQLAGGGGRRAPDGGGDLPLPALPPPGQPMDDGDHRCRALHRHRASS